MFRKKYLWLVLIFNFHLCSAASVADEFENKVIQIKTMQASFTQTLKNDRQVLSKISGKLIIKRPGYVYWKTVRPVSQLIVADGKNLWIYDEDLAQIIKQKLSPQTGGLIAMLVSGYEKSISRYYKISAQPLGKGIVYTLVPKRKNNRLYKYIQVRFDGNILRAIRFKDSLDRITDLRLTNIKMNQKVSNSLFYFTIPAGVDVIQR